MIRKFFTQWLKIFLLIVAGGIALGFVSKALFHTPAFAALATQSIIKTEQNKVGELYHVGTSSTTISK